MPNTRKKLSEAQHTALTTQMDGVCPLDAEPLFYTKGKKSYKNYEVAHIYPLNPTAEELALLQAEERLANDVNDEDNLIPLCQLCHGKFDKPRTVEEYRKLVSIKKRAIERSNQKELWKQHHIEISIMEVVEAIYTSADESIDSNVTFISKKVDEKLNESMTLPTRRKIKHHVRDYYTMLREKMALLDKAGEGTSDIISHQVKAFYLVQKRSGISQQAAFENVVNWLNAKTKSDTKDAAEIIASFFVQNCEIFE